MKKNSISVNRSVIVLILLIFSAGILAACPDESSAASKPVFFAGKTWSQVKKAAERGVGTRYVLGGTSLKGWDCTGYVDWIRKTVCGKTSSTQGQSERVMKKYRKVAYGKTYSQYIYYVKKKIIRPGDVIQMLDPRGHSIHLMLAGDGTKVYHAWCVKTGTVKNSFAKVWAVDGPGGSNYYSAFNVYRGVDPRGSFTLKLQSSNTKLTKANKSYSFAGAKFTLKKSGEKYNLKTGKSGKASLKNIPAGIYTLKMTASAKNYKRDKKTRKVTVKNKKTAKVSFKLKPVVIKKNEKEKTEKSEGVTSDTVVEGTLAGAGSGVATSTEHGSSTGTGSGAATSEADKNKDESAEGEKTGTSKDEKAGTSDATVAKAAKEKRSNKEKSYIKETSQPNVSQPSKVVSGKTQDNSGANKTVDEENDSTKNEYDISIEGVGTDSAETVAGRNEVAGVEEGSEFEEGGELKEDEKPESEDDSLTASASDISVSEGVTGVNDFDIGGDEGLEKSKEGYSEFQRVVKLAGICSVISLIIFLLIMKFRKKKREELFF